MMARDVATVVALVLASALFAAPALAHPLVDQGVQRYEEADFQGALERLDRAEASTSLTRSDVVKLLLYRALVHYATGSRDALDADLFRLASLEPRMELARDVPPRVREAFAQARRRVRAPISLEVEVRANGPAIRVTARVVGDDAGLVRSVRVSARQHGRGARWQRRTDAPIDIEVGDDDTAVEYYAEALGPGRAVLVSEGYPAEPRAVTRREITAAGAARHEGGALHTSTSVRTLGSETGDAPPATTGRAPLDYDEGGDEGSSAAWWIVGGGAVLVAATVVAVVLLTGGGGASDETVLASPTADLP